MDILEALNEETDDVFSNDSGGEWMNADADDGESDVDTESERENESGAEDEVQTDGAVLPRFSFTGESCVNVSFSDKNLRHNEKRLPS
jgi:hypothetical protein